MKKFQFTFTLPDSAMHVSRFVESILVGKFKTTVLMNASLTVAPKDGRALVSFVGHMSDILYREFDVFVDGFTSAAAAYAADNKLSSDDCDFTFFAVGPADEPSR